MNGIKYWYWINLKGLDTFYAHILVNFFFHQKLYSILKLTPLINFSIFSFLEGQFSGTAKEQQI